MSAHSYWRIYITANSGANAYAVVKELEWRTSVGGSQQATGGTALKSSEYSGQTAAMAYDGNTGTNWASDGSAFPHWLGYHFTSAVDIKEISIVGSATIYQSPKDFYIEWSDDGTNWYAAVYISGITTWTGSDTKTWQKYCFSGAITETSGITSWRVSVIKNADGSSVISRVLPDSATSYEMYALTQEPHMLILAPEIDYQWSATKTVASGDYCVATAPDTTPWLFKATGIGSAPHQTHGTTQPTWTNSGTFSDGDITWTYIADLIDPVTIGPKIPT